MGTIVKGPISKHQDYFGVYCKGLQVLGREVRDPRFLLEACSS